MWGLDLSLLGQNCSLVIPMSVCSVAQLCLTLCASMDYSPPGSSIHGIFPGKNTGVSCRFFLQGNLPHPGIELESHTSCLGRWVLYHTCHLGSLSPYHDPTPYGSFSTSSVVEDSFWESLIFSIKSCSVFLLCHPVLSF